MIFNSSTPARSGAYGAVSPFSGGRTAQLFHFGEFTLDQSRYRLQRGDRILHLERRPMELLILLVERRGELVSREEVADRLWGTNVFVEVDHGINTAVRKIRRVLRDDSDEPRFVETVVGKGYRFAAPVTCNGEISRGAPSVEQAPRLPSEPGTPSAAVGSAQKRAASPKTLLPLIILLAIFVSMAAWWLYRGRAPRSEGQPAIHSLAVLPLKNLSGDPAQEYLADGMTEELIGRLSRIHDLRVAVDGFVRTILSSYPSES